MPSFYWSERPQSIHRLVKNIMIRQEGDKNLKIRLNGKEINLEKDTKAKKPWELKTEEEEAEQSIQFVKGLATGEIIHWSLIE